MGDGNGFTARFNFLYLPFNFNQRQSMGYAFVNMVTTQDAQLAWKRFHGYQQWNIPSNKACEVSWGDLAQGLEANIKRFQDSPVMHQDVPDEWKPMLFSDGNHVAFPDPTKAIRRPRLKYRQRCLAVIAGGCAVTTLRDATAPGCTDTSSWQVCGQPF